MQTQYRLLYRYVNPTTNTAITNEADYEPTEEFFHPKHKANVDSAYLEELQREGYDLLYKAENVDEGDYIISLHNEGDKEREAIVTENLSNENKSNNLYVYNGTKKYFHKNFIPDQLGYVVRDWTKVPKSQIPTSPEDYTKHFVMLGGSQLGIDGAYLVCKSRYIDTYMKAKDSANHKCFVNFSVSDNTNKGYSKNAQYYDTNTYIQSIEDIIDEITFFKWYNPKVITDLPQYNEKSPTGIIPNNQFYMDPNNGERYVLTKIVNSTRSTTTDITTKTSTKYSYLFWDNTKETYNLPTFQSSFVVQNSQYSNTTYTGWKVDALTEAGYIVGTYGPELKVDETNIIKEVIPAHYEETGANPYIIRDTYKKIELSPWILHSVYKSLESGLDAAKKLVAMVGINNVKLIKYVPTDQFVKIK